jgi:hypothetical protein
MKKNYKIVPGAGDLCPRCKQAGQIREHLAVMRKQLAGPYYFSRWFKCLNTNCQTTLFMAERFKVINEPAVQGEREAV